MIPWKLIVFLVVFSLVVLFAGFNLGVENRTQTISFVFFEMHDVPVFLSIFISFIAGAILMLPFAIHKKIKRDKKLSEKIKGHDEKTDSKRKRQQPAKGTEKEDG
ncbi:MAG: LapA family protein [Spirochaetales bacterium]|nr:MAG: LapA family protein [Spirochaetales bacterium]